MAKFVVTDEVDLLSYDFHPYVDSAGEIPEPSSKQIRDFKQTFQQIVLKGQPDDATGTVETAEEALRVFANRTDAERAELEQRGEELETALYQAVVDVCSGVFTLEQLQTLPYRAGAAFIGWVLGQFVAPKA